MFRVVWVQAALNELAAIWLQADSALRQAINDATTAIDRALERDPHNQGESRDAGERVFFAYPLGVSYEIDDQQNLVRVLHVWDIRRRR